MNSVSRRKVVYSSTHAAEIEDYPIRDIDQTDGFADHFHRCKPFTMTSKEVMFATWQAAKYVARRGIPGDIVECGVWRGGSALLASLAVREDETHRNDTALVGSHGKPRRTWLYDTFEGMTTPTDTDVDLTGTLAAEYMSTYSDEGRWCYADETDVRGVFAAEGFGLDEVRLVRGDVCETLRQTRPEQIAILRLDTDWYESTKVELELLYPRLAQGGVLIIDDYGHWEGARRAVDEYFQQEPAPLLNRIGYAVRVAVKV
ncbi:hypothetical protein AFEL58S_03543 [Afipia felis]